MQITWNEEGARILRLLPHEWDWLQDGLRKVPREPFARASDHFVELLATVKQLELPAVDWSKPVPVEEPYL